MNNCIFLIRNADFAKKLVVNNILSRSFRLKVFSHVYSRSVRIKTPVSASALHSLKVKNMFSNSSKQFEDSNNLNVTSQDIKKLSTASEEHLSLLLQETIGLQNKKISNWVVENKVKNLCTYYKHLKKEKKELVLKELATKYGVDHPSVVKMAHQMTQVEVESGKMLKMEEKLTNLLTPQYSWLFKIIGRLEAGVKFLVDLRIDIMDLMPTLDPKTPEYIAVQQLNIALRELLIVWFNVGFLKLERITWKSSCSILEKISQYEAVHPVRSWDDLKLRLGPYRRCFVYTHSSMPEEPLAVLHVALREEILSSMEGLTVQTPNQGDAIFNHGESLNQLHEDPQLVKAFIFYSLSLIQRGLQGVDIGNSLIKEASKALLSEYPQATMFSSLSPIPTFRKWLVERIKLAEKGENPFAAGLWDEIFRHLTPGSGESKWSELRKTIVSNSWHEDPLLVSLMKKPLMACCSRYLYFEKRRGYALDSVANLHLRNGAVMWRLNWLADVTPRGLNNSCGLMMNYRYYLDEKEANSIKYVETQEINASQQIVSLAGQLNSKL